MQCSEQTWWWNSLFDENISLVDLTSVQPGLEINLPRILKETDSDYLHNVLVYVSGHIMRLLMTNESCIFCYTYLKECTDRETCYLIKNKQRGGLVNPIVDIVAIVKIAHKVYD